MGQTVIARIFPPAPSGSREEWEEKQIERIREAYAHGWLEMPNVERQIELVLAGHPATISIPSPQSEFR